MAPSKLAAVLAITFVVCAFAAVPTATAYPGGAAEPPESCQTQINYFINCLARDEIRQQCCSVLGDRKCLCQLKREVAVPCHPHRRHGSPCPKNKPPVKLSELKSLPCFQDLKCY
ncbi:hypothetical protein PR202_gn00668 [Eleusine coracana subsp. coracana]|uniref:Bifunctional inhibitor/plant lipid transfer protein/seed storage helical domain-containing protein n=1 Tax=Eleusine coracana subsp. coracana TaxID=191504 RepID=A0AAV5G3D0_ELECO|nr:hypothetical protein QOZ80_2AG0120990 [Eleusine coracana subsp. coracana]GJN41313.1 hypothetical protein PR202_gn00668 [Eleusine coracana subsp. coracana]